MIRSRDDRKLATFAWGALGLLLLSAPAAAEVGVALISEDGAAVPYIVASVTDDSDPIPSKVWTTYSEPTSGRAILNPDGAANADGPPSLGVHPSLAGPIAVWAKNSPGGYDIVVSTFDGAAWSEPRVIVTSPDNELDPSVAIDPATGEVHVLYWVQGGTAVFHTQASPELAVWSAPVQVSLPGEIALRPGAVFHQGQLRVVYEAHVAGQDQVPRQVVMATLRGGEFTSEVVATTSYPRPNRPEIHSDGSRVWVEWIDAEGTMSWTRQEVLGAWDPLLAEPFIGMEDREFHVRSRIRRVAVDPP